jgi:hypothetical protein
MSQKSYATLTVNIKVRLCVSIYTGCTTKIKEKVYKGRG